LQFYTVKKLIRSSGGTDILEFSKLDAMRTMNLFLKVTDPISPTGSYSAITQ